MTVGKGAVLGARCLHGIDHGHMAEVRGKDPSLGPQKDEAGLGTLGVHRL